MPSMISTVFKTLDKDQREQLLIAFNDGSHSVVELEDKMFLGVNIIASPQYDVIETKNNWYYGVNNG